MSLKCALGDCALVFRTPTMTGVCTGIHAIFINHFTGHQVILAFVISLLLPMKVGRRLCFHPRVVVRITVRVGDRITVRVVVRITD